jgi:hypothetical protein
MRNTEILRRLLAIQEYISEIVVATAIDRISLNKAREEIKSIIKGI